MDSTSCLNLSSSSSSGVAGGDGACFVSFVNLRDALLQHLKLVGVVLATRAHERGFLFCRRINSSSSSDLVVGVGFGGRIRIICAGAWKKKIVRFGWGRRRSLAEEVCEALGGLVARHNVGATLAQR